MDGYGESQRHLLCESCGLDLSLYRHMEAEECEPTAAEPLCFAVHYLNSSSSAVTAAIVVARGRPGSCIQAGPAHTYFFVRLL